MKVCRPTKEADKKKEQCKTNIICRNVQSQCRYKSDQDEAEPVKFTQKHPLKEEKLCHGNEKPGTLRQ